MVDVCVASQVSMIDADFLKYFLAPGVGVDGAYLPEKLRTRPGEHGLKSSSFSHCVEILCCQIGISSLTNLILLMFKYSSFINHK